MTGSPPSERDATLTARLRLEPISSRHAHDLWVIHNADEVAAGYDGWKPSPAEADEQAGRWELAWRHLGVHKWMACDRHSGELIGRGGLSHTPADEDWGRITRFLPPEPWATEVRQVGAMAVHARWLEIGWALRRKFWGRGYATEIGRAGLALAFGDLGAGAVVSCTTWNNVRSLAVMERLGMTYSGRLDDLDGGEEIAVSVLLRPDGSNRKE